MASAYNEAKINDCQSAVFLNVSHDVEHLHQHS
jgi:sulfur transfer protein SufE